MKYAGKILKNSSKNSELLFNEIKKLKNARSNNEDESFEDYNNKKYGTKEFNDHLFAMTAIGYLFI